MAASGGAPRKSSSTYQRVRATPPAGAAIRRHWPGHRGAGRRRVADRRLALLLAAQVAAHQNRTAIGPSHRADWNETRPSWPRFTATSSTSSQVLPHAALIHTEAMPTTAPHLTQHRCALSIGMHDRCAPAAGLSLTATCSPARGFSVRYTRPRRRRVPGREAHLAQLLQQHRLLLPRSSSTKPGANYSTYNTTMRQCSPSDRSTTPQRRAVVQTTTPTPLRPSAAATARLRVPSGASRSCASCPTASPQAAGRPNYPAGATKRARQRLSAVWLGETQKGALSCFF